MAYHDMGEAGTATAIANPMDIINRAVTEAADAQKRIALQLEGAKADSARKDGIIKDWENKYSDAQKSISVFKREMIDAVGHVEGLEYPKPDPSFVTTDRMNNLFAALVEEAAGGYAPNTLLTGPQGCGKTSTGYEFAARHNLPVLKMNCQLVREPRDWFGAKGASDGNIHWTRSQFVEVVERGGVVVILDEITRAVPAVLNALMPLLDHTRSAFLEEVKARMVVGPDVYWFGTANIGSQFTGAYGRIDSALSDRFDVRIQVTYLKSAEEQALLIARTGVEEDIARKLVKVATEVRHENDMGGKLSETISTRMLLAASRLYKRIGVAAFEFTILPQFSSENGKNSEQSHVLQLLQGQFGESIAALSA